MNILYLTNIEMNKLDDINTRYIYQDLMRNLLKQKVNLTIVSQTNTTTKLIKKDKLKMLAIKVKSNRNIKNFFKKGLNVVLQKYKFTREIKKHLNLEDYDLVLYYSPPFIFNRTIKFMKRKYNTKTYLMLKDIFPQNSLDLGILRDTGILKLIYKIYRKQEQDLYKLSDYIGCMSEENKNYIIKNNSNIEDIEHKVEVNPNSIELYNRKKMETKEINDIKEKLKIPLNKKIFLYGGNLGKPQGVDFIINVLEKIKDRDDLLFIIVGGGTEYSKLRDYNKNNKNFVLINSLPRQEYEKYLLIADIGLIFLDYRFTIPNYPSRILSYMELSKPVLMASDVNTDMRELIINNNIGYWTPSNDVETYIKTIDKILKENNFIKYGKNSRKILEQKFSVENSTELILNKLKEGNINV